jgi:hypothetical protein
MEPENKGTWFDDEGQAVTEDKNKAIGICNKDMVPEA